MNPWSPPTHRPEHTIASSRIRILDSRGRLLRIIEPVDRETLPCHRHGAALCRTCLITDVMTRRRRGPADYEPMMDGIDAYGDRARPRRRDGDDEDA